MFESITELSEKIAALPKGCVVVKKIGGKPYCYQQYKENGRTVSRYISDERAETMRKEIEERRTLEKKMKELRKDSPVVPPPEFSLSAIFGPALLDIARTASLLEKRDCFPVIRNYIGSKPSDRVCLLYGLRRTGKTTLLKQLVLDMTNEERSRTVYFKARSTDTIADLNRDIRKAAAAGFRYFLIDEITLIGDFIDNAALLSDVYAVQGLKFVLSGTDSLGFWFARNEELYDRTVTVHTTFIPYREHSRLLGIKSIDDYIRYGGTLKAGENGTEDASFYDDESTRNYIYTAVARNIQHSLRCYDRGSHFRHLKTLYEKDELTGAINRIIEDMNHDFTVEVLTRDFSSHDLGSAKDLLRREKNPEKRTDALDTIETEKAVERLRALLEIRNKDEQTVTIEEIHAKEIREYLKALDLIDTMKIDSLPSDGKREEHVIFIQPGMRFCQAGALVSALSDDGEFMKLGKRLQDIIKDKILEDIMGRMLEDIVFYETMKAEGKAKDIFKLRFASGEYDMVIYDRASDTSELYEVKHSTERSPFQKRHLMDDEKIRLTEEKFGRVTKKCVLYRGEDFTGEDGIEYRNVEEYLSSLTE